MEPLEIEGKRYYLVPEEALKDAVMPIEAGLRVPDMMTVEQFAEAFGESPATVRQACAKGLMPAIKPYGRRWFVYARRLFGLDCNGAKGEGNAA